MVWYVRVVTPCSYVNLDALSDTFERTIYDPLLVTIRVFVQFMHKDLIRTKVAENLF